jgi:hypothetical protein
MQPYRSVRHCPTQRVSPRGRPLQGRKSDIRQDVDLRVAETEAELLSDGAKKPSHRPPGELTREPPHGAPHRALRELELARDCTKITPSNLAVPADDRLKPGRDLSSPRSRDGGGRRCHEYSSRLGLPGCSRRLLSAAWRNGTERVLQRSCTVLRRPLSRRRQRGRAPGPSR